MSSSRSLPSALPLPRRPIQGGESIAHMWPTLNNDRIKLFQRLREEDELRYHDRWCRRTHLRLYGAKL
ncbi:hypothetical protein HWV62_27840 [Athelia sp. TMB]|nr:hypothetical protein HWV62_27840 [Athelia sp. TMB]